MRVSTRDVEIHPVNKSIRGRIVSKTVLSESMQEVGQQNEIVCIKSPGGKYLAIDGGSRLEAAKKIGADVDITVREWISDDEVRRYILSTAVRSPFPDIIIDPYGLVVGGMCRAVVDEINCGTPRVTIAKSYGLTPDIVSAYKYLHDDVIEMKEAVASGRMSMTVYSRIKRKPDEFKKTLSEKDGELTYNVVQNAKKSYESGEDGQVYQYNSVGDAVSIRDKLWEMQAHPVPEDAIPALEEAKELIDQLLRSVNV